MFKSFFHQVTTPFRIIGDITEDLVSGKPKQIKEDIKKELRPEPKKVEHNYMNYINKLSDNQKHLGIGVKNLSENQQNIIKTEKDIIKATGDITGRQRGIIETENKLTTRQNKLFEIEQTLGTQQRKLFDTDNKIIKNQNNITSDLEHLRGNMIDFNLQENKLETKNMIVEEDVQQEKQQINEINNKLDNLEEKVVESYYRDLDYNEMTTLLQMLDNKNEVREFLARHRKDYEKLKPEEQKVVKQISKQRML